MNLQTVYPSAKPSYGMMAQPNGPSSIDSAVLRHLKSHAEVETVLHLRDAIDLSAHNSAGSSFISLEKKETN